MSASIDEQFVDFVVRSLVSHPDDVKIDRRVDEKGVLLELTVHPEDLGRVIGKRGATAQSLRTLLRALGTKQEARYNLKIVDVDKIGQEGDGVGTSKVASSDDAVQKPVTPSVKSDDDTDAITEPEKEKESDTVARTRAELADLDDLDI